MVNNPLIRPYFLGGVALGGVARIPLTISFSFPLIFFYRTPNPQAKQHVRYPLEVNYHI